jgi:amidohydrolase
MIENGALEGVDEIYALHNDPKTQIGKIRCLEGAMTANCDIFDITIIGKGGHASTPHNALDPISAAISIISDLNNIIPKNISPFNPAVLGVNYINGGNAENVIPESINFGGIFRSFDEEDRKKIKAQIIQIIENKKNFNYQIEANFTESYPSIVNKKFGQSRVLKAASSFMNEINIIQKGHPETWGEDFAYYLHHVEGAFFILGSGDHAAPPLHSPHYNFNEKALITGIALMAQIGFTF